MLIIVRFRLYICDVRIGLLFEVVLRDGIGDIVFGVFGYLEWMYWLGLELMLRCCNVGLFLSGILIMFGIVMLCCFRRCSSIFIWFLRLVLLVVMLVFCLCEVVKLFLRVLM